MWREIGFFNNDQVINHFKEHLFQMKKSKQSSFFFFSFFFKTRKFEFKFHLFPHLIEGIQLIWQTETCIKSQHCVSNGYTWLRTSRECGNLSSEELKRILFFFFLKKYSNKFKTGCNLFIKENYASIQCKVIHCFMLGML